MNYNAEHGDKISIEVQVLEAKKTGIMLEKTVKKLSTLH